jgi:hypothetical protein
MIIEINIKEDEIDLTDAEEAVDKNELNKDENKKTCKKKKDNDENDIAAS